MARNYILTILAIATSVLVSAQPILMGRRQATRSAGPVSCDTINDASLIAYWRFDEASGNATDTKGANTLTDNGGVGTGGGKISTARLFNPAANTYLSIADNANVSTGDIDVTFGAWVNFGGTLVPGQVWTIFGKWPGGGENEYLLLLDGDTSRFQFFVSSDGTAETGVTANTFGAPVSETWNYVSAWHDSVANTLNIQINNGAVDSVGYSAGIRNGTGALQVGAYGGANYWNGYIDEALLDKRMLTAPEHYSLYNFFGVGCRPGGL